jgi:hypothetical protein
MMQSNCLVFGIHVAWPNLCETTQQIRKSLMLKSTLLILTDTHYLGEMVVVHRISKFGMTMQEQ